MADEVIGEYLRLQETDEPADGGVNFRVVDEGRNGFSRFHSSPQSLRLQAMVVYFPENVVREGAYGFPSEKRLRPRVRRGIMG